MRQVEKDFDSLSKPTLRRHMRALRSELQKVQHEQASSLICERLLSLGLATIDDPIAVFLAKPGEVNIDAVTAELLRGGACVVAPRGTDLQAPFYRLRDIEHGTEIGPFGVREPVLNPTLRFYSGAEIAVALVPGLAFDSDGNRLGYGGGWYDRALSGAALAIGVCFDLQIVDAVPHEPHDRRVSAVVTERRIIDVNHRLQHTLQSLRHPK